MEKIKKELAAKSQDGTKKKLTSIGLLTRIFHRKPILTCGRSMPTALDLNFDWGGMKDTATASKSFVCLVSMVLALRLTAIYHAIFGLNSPTTILCHQIFGFIFFFCVINDFTFSTLHAQQQSMGLGHQRSHGLGWNSQGRSQYGAQMHQNQMGLQQLQQNRLGESSGNQMIQSQYQRGGWNAASRSSYQQQIQLNHQLLQQLQQNQWGTSQQVQGQQRQGEQGEGQQRGIQQQQGRQTFHQRPQGNWNSESRSNYQQQIQQNHQMLQQQQQMRWQERGHEISGLD